jgi:peroxiredoxin
MILKVIYCSLNFMGPCFAADVPMYNPNPEYCGKMAIFEMAKVRIPDGFVIKNWKCN